MEFEYVKLSIDEAYMIREKFVNTFIDTSHKLYIQSIRDLKVNTVVECDRLILSHLWSCLDKQNLYRVDFYSAVRHLYHHANKRVYAMWDIRPVKVICNKKNEGWRDLDYLKNFKSDDVIDIAANELCEILLRDHHIEGHRIGDICEQFLPEDIYVFDETFAWFIAFTHEEFTTHNEKRLCLSNIETIEKLIL